MKFLLTVAAIIAVAIAVPTQRGLVVPGPAGPAPTPEDAFVPIAIGPAIIDSFEPIAIGPAIVNPVEGISVGPAIIPFPVPEVALADEPVIVPSPVTVVDGVSTEIVTGTPLVQIILNINKPVVSSPISVGPAPEFVEIKPDPINIMESAPEPVQVVEVAPEPVQVVEVAPDPSESVAISIPSLPVPVVPPVDLN